jgi:uncharacterized membrane protein YfcA
MPEDLSTYLVLSLAAFAAGVMNSIAGGGTLLTFPALTAVVAPEVANATSTIALMPGSLAGTWGYRRELRPVRSLALLLLVPSALGGWLGSVLVLWYPGWFGRLVPWLILTAAVLFLVQPFVSRFLKRRAVELHSEVRAVSLAAICGFQFLVSTYGGFFGAGIGILMLASLAFLGLSSIHQMNAVKTFLASVINGVSVVVFIRGELIHWPYAGAMAAGAITGGYAGARVARRLPAKSVRWAVVVIAFALAAYYFAKQL